MQTSFMHPPFGFALFYLRSVAPAKEYTDRITKKLIAPVTTMQIYWGAVPFVVIQIIMVSLIIFFPGIVSSGLDKEVKVDLDQVQMQMDEATRGAEVPDELPAAGASAPSGTEGNAADEDPMKAMMESMDKDAAKKK
jgi:GntP family gluconate:H+ symporter